MYVKSDTLLINIVFFFLTVVNMEMISGDSWILANVNVTGFYRVNYDLENWERLIAQLNADHKVHTFILRSNYKSAVPNVFFKLSFHLAFHLLCRFYH